MIKANIGQFCVPVEIIVGGWIWLAHQAIGFKTKVHTLFRGTVYTRV